MTSAIDTNIILDILIPDKIFCGSSKDLLEKHASQGELVLCETVYAELAAHFVRQEDLDEFLDETEIRLLRSDRKTLGLAGARWADYTRSGTRNRWTCSACGHVFEPVCPKCGAPATKRFHVLADFLVGAHAEIQADCLLTRDRGLYRRWFKNLRIISSLGEK